MVCDNIGLKIRHNLDKLHMILKVQVQRFDVFMILKVGRFLGFLHTKKTYPSHM